MTSTKRLDSQLLFSKLRMSWKKAFKHLLPLGGFSSGNKVKIFHHGDEAFLAIYNAFCSARHSIYVEIYMLVPDRVGIWLRDAMIEAAHRGVQVKLLYDHVGSSSLTQAFLDPMLKARIRPIEFNPIWPWRRKGPLLFRNHRKIIVVDEQLAFCGSMNISCDYAGPVYGNDRFRDSMAFIEGPAVKDLLAITKESIAESTFVELDDYVSVDQKDNNFLVKLDRFIDGLFNKPKLTPVKHDTLVQVLRSNNRRNLTHIQKSMEECINRAVDYCYFTTPYFLPYESLRKAIINAAKRGVDIRILTAGLSDVPLMRLASRHVYPGFLKNGVRIYEMNQKTLHAKIATIDGVLSSIGSYNLDHWSARRNLEVNLSILDSHLAQELKEQFNQDLRLAEEISPNIFAKMSLLKRILSWLAYELFRL